MIDFAYHCVGSSQEIPLRWATYSYYTAATTKQN